MLRNVKALEKYQVSAAESPKESPHGHDCR
jgi:hypothetical protein